MTARDALAAYVAHESDEDAAEFEARVDAAVAEAVAQAIEKAFTAGQATAAERAADLEHNHPPKEDNHA